MQWDQTRMQLRRLSADWMRYEPFWYELARQGLRVTALDVPFSLPTRLEHGVEVINWGDHDLLGPYESNRPGLAREIRRRFGKPTMGHEVPVLKTRAQLERVRKDLVNSARRKGELSRWLLETTEWDFFLTVFGECHRGGHILWPEPVSGLTAVPPDGLLEVYQEVDQAVGHVLDGVDLSTTTVIVFSLHGMGVNLRQEPRRIRVASCVRCARLCRHSFSTWWPRPFPSRCETGWSLGRMLAALIGTGRRGLPWRPMGRAISDIT
jgi:predicted AlkP superfamily phosphohydrolase/phosphomutase